MFEGSVRGVSGTGAEDVGRGAVRDESAGGLQWSLGARLASQLVGGGPRTRMIALCAEPGVGRTDIITDALGGVSAAGLTTLRRDLSSLDPDAAARLMVRTSRQACSEREVVVAFDRVPPSDEGCVRREARALRRMWEAGIPAIFSLAPEAAQLLDLLPECVVLGSRDLLVRPVIEAGHGCRLSELRDLTWGVASLVSILLPQIDPRGNVGPLPDSYRAALGGLVSKALRLSQPDEMVRLRLAMILLGDGTHLDLERVLGTVPDDLLEAVRSDVAIMEVSDSLASFKCLQGWSGLLVSSSLSELSATCALFPDVCSSCIEVLVGRASYRRAAELFGLPGSERCYEDVIRCASGFLDVGGSSLVVRAAQSVDATAVVGTERAALVCRAAAAVGDAAFDATPDRVDAFDLGDRDLRLFVEARRALRAQPSLVPYEEGHWEPLERRLLIHREVCDLLARGRLSAAMRILVANPEERAVPSVSTALLRVDFEVARLLLCDRRANDESGLTAAVALLRSEGARGFENYASCVSVMRSVLCKEGKADADVGRLVARAERAGDALAQVVGLLAGCILDLRSGAYARANVRSTLASVVSRRARLDYLARVGGLFGEVAHFLLGESVSDDGRPQPADDLGSVCLLVRETMALGVEAVVADGAFLRGVPRDALWVLLVLSEGMGELSARLRETIPSAWEHALSVARPNWELDEDSARLSLGRENPRLGRAGREEPPVELRLLGGFALYVHGVRVLDERLEHRNAKSLLAFLALQRGGSARRYQIVEQVWPDSDYASGFNRAYQATSAVRSAVAAVDRGLDPFVISRSTKAVTLDPSLVRCDVDEFRLCAREAADGTDDRTTLEMARRAERLYAGDLYLPAVDATGCVARARDELRGLYADAMVAGSDAALRLGQRRTAVRLAASALSTDELREDAAIALVRALRASGRNAEAEHQYRRFSRRLLQVAHRPPSKMLRRAAGGEGRVPSEPVTQELLRA